MTTKTPVCEPDTGLVAALWRFVEDSGSTKEFFALRCRVREHGALYDSAPALLTMLETAFDILDRIADLLLYEEGLPVTALDAREIETIYADAISELAPIETLIRKARGQA
jgi:hypothetical protein